MHDLTRYVEDSFLGSGGFADVVRALNIVTKETVALKKSRVAPDCLARAKREIHVQRRLLHGNVMPVLDWAEDGSWFTMPLARGDLGFVNEHEPVLGAGLLRLVEDVASALSVAHRRGLVHRDLTPGNILWLQDRWVVSDWGFVKLPAGGVRTRLTRTGAGTEGFTAPEVYRDGTIATPACDIYSLGRVVGWLLVGRPLEPNKDVPLDPASPWALFVRETTRADPAERPQTISAALDLLTPVLKEVENEIPELPSAPTDVIDIERTTVDAFKRLLQDSTRRIDIDELVDRETETAFSRLTPEAFPVQSYEEKEQLQERLVRYSVACSAITGVLMNGCAFGDQGQAELWRKTVRRLGRPSGEWGGNRAMLDLRMFPTSLLLYTGGLAAVARSRWFNLTAVATAPVVGRPDREEAPAAFHAFASATLGTEHAQTLPGRRGHYTPGSDWLFEHCREGLRPHLRSDEDYEAAFDRLEYLLAMFCCSTPSGGWVPVGRFASKSAKQRRFKEPTLGDAIKAEIKGESTRWGPIVGGLFADANVAMKAVETVEERVGQLGWH